MSHNTGGPAFPCEWDYIGSNREAATGMTKREYFAIHAEVPWNVVLEGLARKGMKTPTIQEFSEYSAAIRIVMADALIAELAK